MKNVLKRKLKIVIKTTYDTLGCIRGVFDMDYSLSREIKIIKIQDRLEKLMDLLRDELRGASPTEVKHLRREINLLVSKRFDELIVK